MEQPTEFPVSNARVHPPWWKNPAWLVATAVILFLRKSDSLLNPQFWAEDAWPFFIEANTAGFAAFLREYNGYHHFLPRAIAWAAAHFDPDLQPAFYTYSAFLVTLVVAAQALWSRLDLPGKPLLALAIVLVPHTGEVLLTPTNLQWITALGLLLTLCQRDPKSPAEWTADLAAIFIFGFTGPFLVLFAPLCLGRALQRRTRASWIMLAAAAIPASVQGWVLCHSPGLADLGAWHFGPLTTVLAVRLVASLLIGGPLAVKLGAPAAVVLAALILVGVVAALARAPRARGVTLFLLAAFALSLLAAIKRGRPDTWAASDLINGDRYLYPPKVIFLWLVAIIAATATPRWIRRAGGAFLVIGLAANAPQFRVPPLPDLHWANYSRDIRVGRRVEEIPINPGWKVTYPGGRPVFWRR